MKRSVLPILAVLGLVWAAFACASASANPTVLCKANEQPCKAENIYPKGTAIVAETTETTGRLEIATPSVTIKCTSKLEATVGSSSGESLPLSISKWSLGNPTNYCFTTSSNCEGSQPTNGGEIPGEGLPYNVTVDWNIGIGFDVNPSWHIHCKAPGGVEYVNCTIYGLGLGFTFDRTYGESMSISEQQVYGKGGGTGFECPNPPMRLSVTLKFSKPETPIYVSYREPREPPVATTNAASNIKATEAKLHGTVNPEGSATTYWFEYGTSTSYGTKTEEKSAGSGTEGVAVSKTITGLTADTTYDYRLVAENEFGGTSYGANMTVGPPTYRSSFGTEGSGEGQFGHPAGVAVDSSGNLWVVDKGNNRIDKWSPSGEFLFAFGEEGTGNGQFLSPASIAIDSKGNLWVADTVNNRIQEFTAKGEFLLAFGEKGSGKGQFRQPHAVAIDGEGHVWVADTWNARLQEFNSKGSWMTTYTGEKKGQFCEPTGLAFNGSLLYVADWCKDRISEFVLKGSEPSFVREWGEEGTGNSQFEHPDTLAVDSEGNVWVVDEGNYRVKEFTGLGQYITKFGSNGTGAGQFRLEAPTGIAVDSSLNVWVSDSRNGRVQKWSR